MTDFKLTAEQEQLVEVMGKLVPQLGKTFYTAKLAGTDVLELIDKAQRNRINIKFQGPTGSGKTTYFEAFCENTRQPHFVSNMKGSTTSEELIGAFVPNDQEGGNQYVWKNGVIVRALIYSNLKIPVEVVRHVGEDGNNIYEWEKPYPNYEIDVENGLINPDDIIEEKGDDTYLVNAWPRCMLTIEEINFSPEELMSVWFSLMDHRRNIVLNEKDGEVIHAGKFMCVNATMNPHYIGTNPLNDALNDRFLIKLDVDYDVKVENKLINEKARKHDLYAKDVKSLIRFVHLIRKGCKEGSSFSNISTRMIEAYLEIKGQFGDQVAYTSLINSFGEEDQDFAEAQFKMAESQANTITLSEEEMEGLDMASFKGFKPPKTADTKKRKVEVDDDCPWMPSK
jgi:MoxR-like ATPase